jgi:hypothetical protein
MSYNDQCIVQSYVSCIMYVPTVVMYSIIQVLTLSPLMPQPQQSYLELESDVLNIIIIIYLLILLSIYLFIFLHL